MSRYFGRNILNLDGDSDSGDGNLYFKVVINDVKMSNCDAEMSNCDVEMSNCDVTSDSSNVDEKIYADEIIPYNPREINSIFSSVLEDIDSDVESELDETLEYETLNSNTTSDQQQESTVNIDSVKQDNIIELSDDSDEDTEQLEIKQTAPDAPVVNLNAIRYIENKQIEFPTYYRQDVVTNLRKYLCKKTLDHVVNPLIRTTNGYQLRVRDLMILLTPSAWLTDNVIQHYIALSVEYCCKSLEMNTDFVNNIKRSGYDSVFKWFKKNDLNNLNRIVVPANPNKNHWALFVIEIWEGKIYYFDSYAKKQIFDGLKLLMEFFNSAITDYICYSGVKRTAPKVWEGIDGNSPIQLNNTDCGVFTCMNSRYFLLNRPPPVTFTQENIPILRQIIAWELINNVFLNY